MAAATCTEAYTKKPHPDGGFILELAFTWVSSDAGAVTSAVSTTDSAFTGVVLGLKTDPGATAPTSYNIYVKDDTVATLVSKTSASATVTEYTAAAANTVVYDSPLHIEIDTAGDTKIGVAYVYLWVR
jgi:hypothetical protein